MAAHPNGTIAVGVEERGFNPYQYIVYIVDRPSETVLFQFDTEIRVDQVTISHDEELIILPSQDGQIRVIETATFHDVHQFQPQHDSEYGYTFENVTISPNNRWLVVTYSTDITEIWNLEDGSFWGTVYHAEFDSNGNTFAAIESGTFTLRFYDAISGELVLDSLVLENVADVELSPDGRILAVQTPMQSQSSVTSMSHEVSLYDIETQQRLLDLEAVSNPIFSPDGTLLAVQAADRRLIVYGIE